MQEGIDIPPLTPILKPEIGKPTRFFTPLSQRIVATALGAAIAVPVGVAAWNNKPHPDSLPTNEPIVRTIDENIRMYPREVNDNVRDWESKVNEFLMAGNEIEVQQFEIDVQPGSESVKLRSFPEFDLQSPTIKTNIIAELFPGYSGSFYRFSVDSTDDGYGNNDWYVIFLNPTTKGEAPILAFLKGGKLTEESVNPIGRPIKIRMLERDSEGFPVGDRLDDPGTALRIGYLGLTPISPKLDVA